MSSQFTYYLPDEDTGILTPQTLEVPFFINTEEFRREGLYFMKNNKYPDFEDDDYWDEQEDRILNGYSVGGVKITGEHYHYLNFNRIMLTPEANEEAGIITKGLYKKKTGRKIPSIADFWDGDFEYYWLKQIAKENGLHFGLAKSRRKGFSYKGGASGARRLKFYANSLTLYVASDKKYLYQKGKGIFIMARDAVNFMNRYTPWAREKLINQQDHIKDGYTTTENGVIVEKGFLSELVAISAGNNPDVARGKDGAEVYIEEGGTFPNLEATLESTKPIVEDGDIVTGQIVLGGTGGSDDADWTPFETVFFDPEGNGFLAVENKWDENKLGTKCCYYFPHSKNLISYYDKDGNSNEDGARAYRAREEKKIRAEKLTKWKTERSNCPRETFSRLYNNIFPKEELESYKQYLISTGLWRQGTPIELHVDANGEIKSRMAINRRPIYEFPYKGDDMRGAIVMWDAPFKINGKVPPNLYIICHDPYAVDGITGSLGATYVIEQPNNLTRSGGDMIVASYVGRHRLTDDYNRELFMLAEFYNAKIGFENDRGDVIGYAKRFKKLDWLQEEFELAYDDNLKGSTVRRGFGMHMGSGKEDKRKMTGNGYIHDWLLTPRKTLDTGEIVLNLHGIKDIGLLEELLKYGEGNYDRVSAFRVGMYHIKELEYKNIRPQLIRQKKIFSGKELFQ